MEDLCTSKLMSVSNRTDTRVFQYLISATRSQLIHAGQVVYGITPIDSISSINQIKLMCEVQKGLDTYGKDKLNWSDPNIKLEHQCNFLKRVEEEVRCIKK